MKKLFILFLSGLLLVSCKNQGIEPDTLNKDEYYIPLGESIKVADSLRNFILGNVKQRASTNSNVGNTNTTLKKEIQSEDGLPIMRVFNYGNGGFIILAADRRANPVLAYSDETNFPSDTIPAATEAWLYENKLQIEELKSGVKENLNGEILLKKGNYINLLSGQVPSVNLKRASTGKVAGFFPPAGGCEPTGFEIGPLLQTTWDQIGGYNNLMPDMTCTPFYCNAKAYTGCVATAMAQVMRYHQYPTSYNYGIMPNAVSSYLDFSTGANEISKLMRDAANSVNSQPNCNGTGAASNLNDIPYALENSFGYSVTATAADFNYNTVKSEIQANRPVILSGYKDKSGFIFHTYDGGHVWVVDGVRGGTSCGEQNPDGTWTGGASYLYFHMNWGWGGSNNGWFGFASADAGNGSNYQYKRGMVYSIKK